MSEDWKHQHIAAALSASLEVIKSNIITIVIFVVLGSRQEDSFTLYLVGGSFVLVLLTGLVRWWTFTYSTEAGVLRIKKGVLVRRDITLTRERIQVMDIAEGFVERIFGLVNVRVQTGSQSEAINLRAVTKEEAKLVIRVVLDERQGIEATDSSAEIAGFDSDENQIELPGIDSVEGSLLRTDTSHHEEPEEARILLSKKELILAAVTSGGLGIALSILGTLYSQLEAVLGVSTVVDWVVEKAPGLQSTPWSSIAILFFLFFIIAWLLSTSGFLLANSGFVIRKYADKLVISRGLIERKQTTLPYDRIQAVRFVEGLLRQPFGRGTIYVESAGFGNDQGSGSTLLFPILKKTDLSDWIDSVVRLFHFSDPDLRPPMRALPRMIRRMALPIAFLFGIMFALFYSNDPILFTTSSGTILTDTKGLLSDSSIVASSPKEALPGWFSRWAISFFGVLITVFVYAYVRWKTARLGLFTHRMSTRFRRIAREEAVIPSHRIQSMQLTQSWFQKRKQLCSLHVRIASGLTGRAFTITDLDHGDGEQAVAWYREEIRSLRRST